MTGLRLIPAGAADCAALASGVGVPGLRESPGGVEPEAVQQMLVGLARRQQTAQGWGCWFMVEGGQIVGSCAVKDPVDQAGAVEIGYAVAPERRGQGIGSQAIGLLLVELARHGVTVVRAGTAVGNLPSQRVPQRNGFELQGNRHDVEDGAVMQWARAGLPPA